jgi:hypothetical protein
LLTSLKLYCVSSRFLSYRIAQIKARKDKEREVVNEEYERRLQEAYQMNREAQRKLKSKIASGLEEAREEVAEMRRNPSAGAIAFDINFDDDDVRRPHKCLVRASSDGSSKSSKDNSAADEVTLVSPSVTGYLKSPHSMLALIDPCVYLLQGRQRRGWGPRGAPAEEVSQKLRGAAVCDNAGAKEVEEKLHPRDNESPFDEKDQEVADGFGFRSARLRNLASRNSCLFASSCSRPCRYF